MEEDMSTYIRWEGKVRETGTRVQILDLAHADAEFDGEGLRWATICMDHSSICTHPTSQLAWDHAAHPLGWCGICNGSDVPAPVEPEFCTHVFKDGTTCSRMPGHRGKHQRGPVVAAKKVTVAVWGPNLGNERGGEAMHVHSDDCADTKRGVYLRADKPWILEVSNVQEIVEDIYQDMLAESPESTWADYAGDVRVFPCTGL